MRLARWGLVTLIFAVAFVFFGSVICPPLDERKAEQQDAEVQYPLQEDPGTYKPLPGDLQIEDRFPIERDALEPEEKVVGADQVLHFQVLSDQGSPLGGAMVTVLLDSKDGPTLVQEIYADLDGKVSAVKIPPSITRFRAVIQHPGHFDAEIGPVDMPVGKPGTYLAMLPTGGRIEGKVQSLQGKNVVHGSLVLTPMDGGKSMKLPTRAGGRFTSAMLPAGNYRLHWTASATAEVLPSLTYTMSLTPPQVRYFEITVPGSQEPAAEGLVVGILEVPQ